MIFDQPPAELPVATLMPKSRGTKLATGITAWLAARWRWFRPRTVPMLAAAFGLCAVVGFASYLKNYGREDAERLTPPPSLEPIADATAPPAAPLGKLVIKQGPDGADVIVDGKRLLDLPQIELKPGCDRTLDLQSAHK